MCGGIWFQILGPQTEKTRFLNWVRNHTTKAALVVVTGTVSEGLNGWSEALMAGLAVKTAKPLS